MAEGYQFLSMHSVLLESLTITDFQATEAYSYVDLGEAKYGVSRLSMVKKENVILQMNPSNFIACRKIKLI